MRSARPGSRLGRDRRGDGRRRVHDDEVAGGEVVGEIGERRVRDPVPSVGDEESHVVATAASHLGGLTGFERGSREG